jgi:ParB family chromosome partitioning protein
MADALERGHDEDDLALMFGVSVQTVRATLSLLDATQAVAMQWSPEQSPLPRRVSWHRLNPKSSGKRSEIEAATAGTTGHEKARRQRQSSVKQSRASNPAKKSLKPWNLPG